MNGTFWLLSAPSGARSNCRLQARRYWGPLYATYGNWLFTTLAAIFGTAASTPIASAVIMRNRGKKVSSAPDS
jgi:(hydroxyamino)benzene mutase